MNTIDNQLVHQKDALLTLVNEGQYEEAITILNFVAPLWESAGYDYKTREIRKRIQDACRRQEMEATHHKTVEKWQKLYRMAA